MFVSKALNYINTIITDTVESYKLSEDSKDDSGNYIVHPLENKDDANKLEALYFGLRDAALNTTPLALLESNDSTATEFKKISSTEFIRVPTEPTIDGVLDTDEGLAFAVIYKALSFLWVGYNGYASDADAIYASYNDAMRDYFMHRDSDTVYTETIFFRYSSDGLSWHDNYVDGDIYISFKQGDGVWSSAIRFVGKDGDSGTGSGATTFLELTDTPDTYTAGKFLAVNAAGDAIEEVDAPESSGVQSGVNGNDDASGDIVIDFLDASIKNINYLYLSADATIDILNDVGTYSMVEGQIYTLQIFPNGFTCTINFEALGDTTVNSSIETTIFQIFYDGFDIFVLNKTEIA